MLFGGNNPLIVLFIVVLSQYWGSCVWKQNAAFVSYLYSVVHCFINLTDIPNLLFCVDGSNMYKSAGYWSGNELLISMIRVHVGFTFKFGVELVQYVKQVQYNSSHTTFLLRA